MSSFDHVFSYTLFFLLFISFTNCGTCKTSNSLEFCNINSDTMTQLQSGGSCLSDCCFVACVCYLTHMARFSICTAFLKVILCISSTVLSASASVHFLVSFCIADTAQCSNDYWSDCDLLFPLILSIEICSQVLILTKFLPFSVCHYHFPGHCYFNNEVS